MLSGGADLDPQGTNTQFAHHQVPSVRFSPSAVFVRVWGRDPLRHQILSTKEIYYPRGRSRGRGAASGSGKGRQQAAVWCSVPEWVFKVFKEKIINLWWDELVSPDWIG